MKKTSKFFIIIIVLLIIAAIIWIYILSLADIRVWDIDFWSNQFKGTRVIEWMFNKRTDKECTRIFLDKDICPAGCERVYVNGGAELGIGCMSQASKRRSPD